MVQNPPEGCQRIAPYLIYEDAPAAIDFLCRAFGFEERFRLPGPDGAPGSVGHAELGFQGNIVMLASLAAARTAHASDVLPGRCALTVVYVDDVDAHYAAAKAAGATVGDPPADQFYGDRTYRVTDPEGHKWFFHQHVKDVAFDQMAPTE